MAKCLKCGTELVYIDDENINYCPNCGTIYQIAQIPEDFTEDELSDAHNKNIVTYEDTKHSKYDKMSVAPTIGGIISLIIYAICLACQYSAKTPVGVMVSAIFGAIALIISYFCFVYAIVYKCIDRYHIKTVAPMQDEIAELKKEIENLKKVIK